MPLPVSKAGLPLDNKLLASLPRLLHVPGGAHGEAMRRLAQKYPGLPMLVVTGFHEPPPVPYEALFTKPFDTPALLAAVEQLHARHLAALTR